MARCASDHPGQPGTIRECEVELVRRILYAFGGEGSVAITRPEAEVLFDINDNICDPQSNAAWTDLFVKAVTNVVMAASGQAVPTREEALRRDAWLMEAKGELSPLALLSAMVSSSIDAVRATYQEQSAEERALARLEQQRIEIITNEEITQAEAAWLCERIGRDGRLTPTRRRWSPTSARKAPRSTRICKPRLSAWRTPPKAADDGGVGLRASKRLAACDTARFLPGASSLRHFNGRLERSATQPAGVLSQGAPT